MRRVAVFLALYMCLTAGPAGAALPAEVYAGADQVALSVWLQRDGSRLMLYLAQGGRHVDVVETPQVTSGVPAYGAVGRGRCTLTKKGGACKVRGKIYPLTTEFEMDPLMETAHLTLDAGKYTHVVDWIGRETVAQDSDVSDSEGYVSLYRPASATATLFGTEFDGGELLGLMQNDLYAGDGDGLLEVQPDGRFSARLLLDAERQIVLPSRAASAPSGR